MKWLIPIISFILACVSLITLKSIAPDLVMRQFGFFILGFIIFYGLNLVRFEKLQQYAFFSYGLFNLVLVLLLIIGQSTRSTVRWINLFSGFKLQPSTFAVLIISMFLTLIFKKIKFKQWRGLFKLIAIIALPSLLIFLQPDFGSSLVIMASLSMVFLLIPIKFKQLATIFLAGLLILAIAWVAVLKPYQKNRVTSFLSAADQQDASATYNARQALIAVGSGGVFGRGLGFGVQSHLKFLPERQTDFVFASLAEEWGFVGSFILVSLYFVLIITLLIYAFNIPDVTHKLYLLALIANLFIQVVVNVGMNLGLLPITGITLPLVSYGGSSVIAFMTALGLAFNIIQQQKPRLKLWIK